MEQSFCSPRIQLLVWPGFKVKQTALWGIDFLKLPLSSFEPWDCMSWRNWCQGGFNPFEKNVRQIGSCPHGVKIKKCLESPPRSLSDHLRFCFISIGPIEWCDGNRNGHQTQFWTYFGMLPTTQDSSHHQDDITCLVKTPFLPSFCHCY